MNHLAYLKPCAGCGTEIFMAICRDGRWRPFDTRQFPAADNSVWAWRKRHGMEEQELVPGHHIHLCPAYHHRIDLAGALT